MIVYKGSDVVFSVEEPKTSFWMHNTSEWNQSYAKTCESVKEMGNATGILFLKDHRDCGTNFLFFSQRKLLLLLSTA